MSYGIWISSLNLCLWKVWKPTHWGQCSIWTCCRVSTSPLQNWHSRILCMGSLLRWEIHIHRLWIDVCMVYAGYYFLVHNRREICLSHQMKPARALLLKAYLLLFWKLFQAQARRGIEFRLTELWNQIFRCFQINCLLNFVNQKQNFRFKIMYDQKLPNNLSSGRLD